MMYIKITPYMLTHIWGEKSLIIRGATQIIMSSWHLFDDIEVVSLRLIAGSSESGVTQALTASHHPAALWKVTLDRSFHHCWNTRQSYIYSRKKSRTIFKNFPNGLNAALPKSISPKSSSVKIRFFCQTVKNLKPFIKNSGKSWSFSSFSWFWDEKVLYSW